MRTTRKSRPRLEILRSASIFLFAALVLVWIAVTLAPTWDSLMMRTVARLAGYVAFVAMLVPYLHILRRCFRYRVGIPMTRWLRWHIGAAYLAFFMVLLHSQGRAQEPLTEALLWLTWIVMVSGVAGFYGQKLLYFLLPRMVAQEFGLERLEPQRLLLLETATQLMTSKEIKQSPEIVQDFFTQAVELTLAPPFSVWKDWFSSTAEQLSDNWYQRTRTFADPLQGELLSKLWELMNTRRMMNREYRLHQVGRFWLLVHGPAAWALFVLMIEHAVMSMWYGGF